MEEVVKTAAAHGCKFILFVVADSFTNTHKDMKFFERKYECVTQQIKVSNMDKIMRENKVSWLSIRLNRIITHPSGIFSEL